MFSLFRPICKSAMPWESCSSSSSSSVSRAVVVKGKRGGDHSRSDQYHAFQFGLGFGVKGREAEERRKRTPLGPHTDILGVTETLLR